MNKKEIEKMFDEAPSWIYTENREKLKEYIFIKIIPEVLRSVLPEEHEGGFGQF